MAYTVGSASVEIVPDFRNAQLAITAFFAKQQNELKIPVKLDTDGVAGQAMERQARQLGSRTGKAMNDGMQMSQGAADRLAIQQAKARERAILQAHAEAHRMNDRMNRDAEKAAKALLDSEAKARIEAEREVVRAAQGEEKVRLQAHAEALRMQADLDRAMVRTHAEALRMNAELDRARAASARADEASARAALRNAEKLAAERLKIDQEANRARLRQEEQFQRQEEAFARRSGQAIARIVQQAEQEELKRKLKIEMDERDAERKGRTVGGLITRAVHEEIRQNAGLISGVLAAVLAAGAPAALGAAAALFIGIGAVAAAQSERVRQAWTGLWDQIKSGSQSDAAILVPTFERMAGAIGQSFQRMRPLIRDAFTSVSPQIDSFTASLTQAAENALPGLVRAVKLSGPAVSGLGDLLEKVGTGVGNFFTVLSTHAPAAGAAASELGDALAALLPTLAELLGQGAETASVVLPLLTGALQTLNTVVTALGGSMPVLTTAFLGFRVAQGAGRLLKGWSISLLESSAAGGMFSTSMGRAGTALGTLSKAAPVLGVAVGLLGAIMAASQQQINDWTQALNEGGDAARKAQADMAAYDAGMQQLDSGFTGFLKNFSVLGSTFGMVANDTDEAKAANEAYIKSLTPLESAQRNVSIASRDLARLLGDESATSADLQGAKRALARASAEQAREEDRLAMATLGVTQAMQEQADAARGRADANFGYQRAVLDVAEAQQKLKDTLADTESSALDVSKAMLDVNEALKTQVDMAGDKAMQNLPAAMDDSQKAIIGAQASLDELNALIAKGVVLDPTMEQYRQSLIDIAGGADQSALAQAQLSAALGEVGASVEAIPDSATIEINDPSPAVIARLKDLGFTVTNLPDGDVRVEAETDEAKAHLATLSADLATLDTTTAKPDAILEDGSLRSSYGTSMQALNQLNGQHPTPVASLTDRATGPTRTLVGLVDLLGGRRPTPTASVRDLATAAIRSIGAAIASLHDKTITITTLQQGRSTTGGAFAATGGAVEDVLAGRNLLPRYDGGGATFGIGGPLDDLNTIRVSPGEHVFDARDVGLMGGQAGVYAFREMLNRGMFGNFSSGTGVRQMVAAGGSGAAPAAAAQAPRNVRIYTSDNPTAIIRAMRADEHQQAALAPVWPV